VTINLLNIGIEKSATKAIALVDNKIDCYLLQQRQIIKALGTQIDIEYLLCTTYAAVSFQSIAWIIISVIVTINWTVQL
jgi:hypothetical protein